MLVVIQLSLDTPSPLKRKQVWDLIKFLNPKQASVLLCSLVFPQIPIM